jgi:hypothetical protein
VQRPTKDEALKLAAGSALALVGAGFKVTSNWTGSIFMAEIAWALWYLAIALIVVGGYQPSTRWATPRWKMLGDFIDRTSPFPLLFCVIGCLGFLFSAPGRAETILSEPDASNALFSVLLGSSLGTAIGLVQVTPHHRDAMFRRLRVIGWLGPLVVVGCFLTCTVAFFSCITVYSSAHFAEISDLQALPIRRLASFYVWHFLELLPFGNIPKTLHWPEPLRYDSIQVGARVVVFQVITVSTIVATFRAYWKYVHTGEDVNEAISKEKPLSPIEPGHLADRRPRVAGRRSRRRPAHPVN